jgi:hypothetical protein
LAVVDGFSWERDHHYATTDERTHHLATRHPRKMFVSREISLTELQVYFLAICLQKTVFVYDAKIYPI